jgi:signal peptidase I
MDYGGGIGMSKIHGTNIHILSDENLDGVLREYVEVDRKAKEGDYVSTRFGIHIVSGYNHSEIVAGDLAGYYSRVFKHGDYKTLEPTNIIRLREGRYRLVDRKAKVGDRIIIVDGKGWYRDKVGNIYEVIHSSKYGFEEDDDGRAYVEYEKNEYDEAIHYVRRENYRVLEPVEPAENELVTAEEGDPKSTLDLLANLARRVTELEWKLQTTQENYNKVFEKILDDIVTLDERTQPLVALAKAVKADE